VAHGNATLGFLRIGSMYGNWFPGATRS